MKLSIAAVVLVSFVCVFAIHQASRAAIGKAADRYPSGAIVAGGMFWFLTANIAIGIFAFLSALFGHYASLFVCKKYALYEKKDK